jgi:hypothetical protein
VVPVEAGDRVWLEEPFLHVSDGWLNLLFFQLLRSLGQGQVIGHKAEVATRLVLLNADCLEKKGPAMHVDMQKRNVPVAGRDFGLFNVEGAALLEMSEQPAEKLDFFHKVTVYFGDPVLTAVHPDVAGHAVKHGSLVRGGVKGRVGSEEKLGKFALTLSVAGSYGVGQHLHQAVGALGVFLLVVLTLFLLARVAQQIFDAMIFPLSLLRRNWLASDCFQAIEVPGCGLNYQLELMLSRLVGLDFIHPVAVIVGLCLQFSVYYSAQKVASRQILVRWARGAGGECARGSEKDERKKACTASNRRRLHELSFGPAGTASSVQRHDVPPAKA